ncbi:type II toxin-antitoxin system VapC family toxin [Microbacterium suaedae]|uniref:type II toxin-antitoxin system VapC family toxin n=1 Tax=Microbacterium suaedae TaxID=2067813 RepID=UPI0013A63189|nr:type II toxin-antitoxin system VapC family toxin [Microbacterium suaedae]
MGNDAVLVDATVVLHALGDVQPQRDICRAFLDDLWAGSGRAYASTEMIQEVVFHRLRRDDRAVAAAAARRIVPLFIVLNFDHEVLELSLDLVEKTSIRGRDAVHAATALAYGIETIASSDAAFDEIPGLRRIDPLRATAGS